MEIAAHIGNPYVENLTVNLRDAYVVLELPVDASLAEVEKAYRELTSVWNPDRFSDTPSLQQRAEQKLRQLNEARRILRTRAASDSIVGAPSWQGTVQTASAKAAHDGSRNAAASAAEGSPVIRSRRFRKLHIWAIPFIIACLLCGGFVTTMFVIFMAGTTAPSQPFIYTLSPEEFQSADNMPEDAITTGNFTSWLREGDLSIELVILVHGLDPIHVYDPTDLTVSLVDNNGRERELIEPSIVTIPWQEHTALFVFPLANDRDDVEVTVAVESKLLNERQEIRLNLPGPSGGNP